MSLFNYLPVFFLATILQLGCDDDNTRSGPEVASGNKAGSSQDQDSTDELYINLKGDSVTYHHWDVDDEILGVANTAFGDLDSIIARRYIRVLVPYSKTYYYTEGMKRYGLAYDLLNLFEKDLNKQLNLKPSTVRVIFIPVSREHIIPLLNSGRADMIASGYTITDERKKQIDFSLPTVTGIRDVLVAGPSAPPIRSIEELAGKKVYVRENTSYQSSLARVNELLHKKNLQPIDIQFTGPYLEAEDILEMVDQGMIPYTVVSEDIGTLWKNIFTNLKVYQKVAIDSNVSYGWAFRNSSPKLKAAVNKFIPKIQKGSLTGNMLYDKYIKSPGRLRNAQSKQALADLANFRKLFIKYGETYALDWLLLSAQAFQESQLKQETLSHAGAVGVMQVLPSTAKAPPISIPNIKTADNNIHAGVKYMRWLIDTYFAREPMDSLNRHLFALAAYNAGPGNVRKLRRIAREKGMNPNEWFGNVELLAARHISMEPVTYVNNIYRYYWSYQALQRFKDLREGKKPTQATASSGKPKK